jgi:hypothetical protein
MSQMEMLEAARREYDDDKVQPYILKILEPGNEFLQELVDQFGKTRQEANKVAVACFYELKPSNVGKIVGKEDRIVSLGKEPAFHQKLIVGTAICGQRKLWLPRPV